MPCILLPCALTYTRRTHVEVGVYEEFVQCMSQSVSPTCMSDAFPACVYSKRKLLEDVMV